MAASIAAAVAVTVVPALALGGGPPPAAAKPSRPSRLAGLAIAAEESFIESRHPDPVSVGSPPGLTARGPGSSSGSSNDAVPAASTAPGSIPHRAEDAYATAARKATLLYPECHLGWEVLAGIGRVESVHGQLGGSAPSRDGVVSPPVLGPVLTGAEGTQAIADTDDGVLDGNTTWDRAVGPMQFLPSTWTTFGSDANSDGVNDPNNIYDASLAAARYLCGGGGDLRDADDLAVAIFSYNHSTSYVEAVLGIASAYGGLDLKPDAGKSMHRSPRHNKRDGRRIKEKRRGDTARGRSRRESHPRRDLHSKKESSRRSSEPPKNSGRPRLPSPPRSPSPSKPPAPQPSKPRPPAPAEPPSTQPSDPPPPDSPPPPSPSPSECPSPSPDPSAPPSPSPSECPSPPPADTTTP